MRNHCYQKLFRFQYVHISVCTFCESPYDRVETRLYEELQIGKMDNTWKAVVESHFNSEIVAEGNET